MYQIKTLEEKFINPKTNADCELKIYGNAPVLLSAPHSTNHKKEGNLKLGELYTGSIAEYLARAIGCAVITKTNCNESAYNDDPNAQDEFCTYKQKIVEFMKKNKIILFVDFHGLSKEKECIVDIGLNEGKNTAGKNYPYCLQRLIERRFPKSTATIDKYCKASLPNNLSRWMSEKYNVCSVQLEINGSYREFEGLKEHQSIRLLNTLLEWLNRCIAK